MHCYFQPLKLSPCVTESRKWYFPESLTIRVLLYIATVKVMF